MGGLGKWIIKWQENIKQFFKFQAASVIAWLVDYTVFTLIFKFIFFEMQYTEVYAVMVSYIAGVITSYLINKSWTFKVKRQVFSVYLIKFFVVNIAAISAKSSAVYILSEFYNVNPYISALLAVVFSFSINYSGNKIWVFEGK